MPTAAHAGAHDAALPAEALAADFRERGYAVARGVFAADEIAAMADAIERVRRWALQAGSSFRRHNIVAWLERDAQVGAIVRGMQWAAHLEPALEAARVDRRMLALLRPLIGDDLRQIINQIHWKPPGARVGVQFHTDRENRKPAEAFRDLERSYVQTAICIDPMTPRNGPLLVVPGSHRRQHALKDGSSNFGDGDADRALLARSGYGPDDAVALSGEPGDVLLWHVDTIHGSDVNRDPGSDRRIYINGYCAARATMRGQWAFIRGMPVPLPPVDVPVLIQCDRIWEEPEPSVHAPMPAMRD